MTNRTPVAAWCETCQAETLLTKTRLCHFCGHPVDATYAERVVATVERAALAADLVSAQAVSA